MIYSEGFSDLTGWSDSPDQNDSINSTGNLAFGNLEALSPSAGASTVYCVDMYKSINHTMTTGQKYYLTWVCRYDGATTSTWSKAGIKLNPNAPSGAGRVTFGQVQGQYWNMNETYDAMIGYGTNVPVNTTLFYYVELTWDGSALRTDMWVYSDSANLPSAAPATSDASYLGGGNISGFSGTFTDISLDVNPNGTSLNYSIDELRLATTFAEAVPQSTGGSDPTGGSAVIWPIGDSITAGAGGQPWIGSWGFGKHYRAYLENTFVANNVTYNFVGTLNGGANYVYNGAMLDADHQGHSGLGVDHFLSNVDTYAGQLQATPTIITMHLGTNDYTNQTVSTMQPKYEQLLGKLRTNFPDANIIVQGVGERLDQTLTTSRTDMNNMLSTIVTNLTSAGDSKIQYVDNLTTVAHVTDFNPDWQGNDAADSIHPNPAGHEVIANQFWSAISPLLSGGGSSGGTSSKILFIGDSITYGTDGDGFYTTNNGGHTWPSPYNTFPASCVNLGPGYRAYVQKLLADGGYDITTVGTQTEGGGAQPYIGSDATQGTILPNFMGEGSQYHEGYPGQRIDQVKSLLQGNNIIATQAPDIVLVMLGVNDIRQGASQSVLQGRIDSDLLWIVDQALAANSNAHVFIAKVTQSKEGNDAMVQTYNNMIQTFVNAQSGAGKKVYVVDNYTNVEVSDIDPTGVHPTQVGYRTMAQNWYNAIAANYSTGTSSGYDAWASNNGVSSNGEADDDGDGLKNLVEYAFDANSDGNATPDELPVYQSLNSDKLTISFKADPNVTDVTYTLEESRSLDFSSPIASNTITLGTGSTHTVQSSSSVAGQKLFLRVKVTK